MNFSHIDLVSIIGTEMKRVANIEGGEWAGPCPFCGGRDRLRVQPHAPSGPRWWCRQCSDGDRWSGPPEFIMRRDNLSFVEAARKLGAGDQLQSRTPMVSVPQPPETEHPPSEAWQAAATALAAACDERLGTPAGARALEYLYGRGLTLDTILGASLGYNDEDRWFDCDAWGIAPWTNEQGEERRRIWVPRGIVIPFIVGGHVWAIQVRRPINREATPDERPYIFVRGSANALYGVDDLELGGSAVVTEGVMDALAVRQEVGAESAAVALGGTTRARRTNWIARLSLCNRVLIALDADKAGESASGWWLSTLGDTARRWAPTAKDAADMLKTGHDIPAWVEDGLARVTAPSFVILAPHAEPVSSAAEPPVLPPVGPVVSPPDPAPVAPPKPTRAGTRPATDDEVRRLAEIVARGILDDGRQYARYLERAHNVAWDAVILGVLAEDDGRRWEEAGDDDLPDIPEPIPEPIPDPPVVAAPLAVLAPPVLPARRDRRYDILEEHAWIDLQRLSLERARAAGNQEKIDQIANILDPIDMLIAELAAA